MALHLDRLSILCSCKEVLLHQNLRLLGVNVSACKCCWIYQVCLSKVAIGLTAHQAVMKTTRYTKYAGYLGMQAGRQKRVQICVLMRPQHFSESR
jgi:hypothetical protein